MHLIVHFICVLTPSLQGGTSRQNRKNRVDRGGLGYALCYTLLPLKIFGRDDQKRITDLLVLIVLYAHDVSAKYPSSGVTEMY